MSQPLPMNPMPIIEKLCTLRRDLVSNGYDQALLYLQEQFRTAVADELPFDIWTIPSGREVWDWRVPQQWELKRGQVWGVKQHDRGESKHILIDSRKNHGLSVASYSSPVSTTLPTTQFIENHLHTSEACPDAIPFHYHYYDSGWSFCCEERRRAEFEAYERVEIEIDSTLSMGELKVGQVVIPGRSEAEILVIAHLCHPYQAEDNATGCAALIELARAVAQWPEAKRHYTMRFLWSPETIGMIAYLSRHPHVVANARMGICPDMLGLQQNMVAVRSRGGNALIDRAIDTLFSFVGDYGEGVLNDEKVLNAPGVEIPCVAVNRALWWGRGEHPYPEYHTSADSADRVHEGAMYQSIEALLKLIETLHRNWVPVPVHPGLLHLSKHGVWTDEAENSSLFRAKLDLIEHVNGRLSVIDLAHRQPYMGMTEAFAFFQQLADSGGVHARPYRP